MFHPKTIRFLIICCTITIGAAVRTETREGSDVSDDNPSHIPDHNELVQDPESFDNSDASDDSSSEVSRPNHKKYGSTMDVSDDETSEDSDEEWFCVEANKYKRFQTQLNRFFARSFRSGHHRYPSRYRYRPRFYQLYPRGYRCEQIKYLHYQNIAGILYKVVGIFCIRNSTMCEEKEILAYQDARRKIQWTWP